MHRMDLQDLDKEQVAVNSMNSVRVVVLTLAALEEQMLEVEPQVLLAVLMRPKATQYDEHNKVNFD